MQKKEEWWGALPAAYEAASLVRSSGAGSGPGRYIYRTEPNNLTADHRGPFRSSAGPRGAAFSLVLHSVRGEFCETLVQPEKIAQKQNGDRVIRGAHGRPENEGKLLSKRSNRSPKPSPKKCNKEPVARDFERKKNDDVKTRGKAAVTFIMQFEGEDMLPISGAASSLSV
ncbi:hypothetical protein NDU88_001312 [Pleurodeles waltl]|uniref:Uncharacterized protein n=1 Tax=Pleurodeles waltl TaxID=8319 RepID=A0AAV7LH32_PLEWA|nr:hypothetical protein NDU88_001312 [Pleurodeles waltl]